MIRLLRAVRDGIVSGPARQVQQDHVQLTQGKIAQKTAQSKAVAANPANSGLVVLPLL
jgi:hypothetical protein